MGKYLVTAGLAAAFTMTSGAPRQPVDVSSARQPSAKPNTKKPTITKKDRRRVQPGIHRAGPAELAVRDRVARGESAKLERCAAPRAGHHGRAAVGAGDHVGQPRPDRRAEGVQLLSTIAGVDSGRPNSIVVDPRDANVVYMAVLGRWRVEVVRLPVAAGPDVGADDGHAAEPRGRCARDRSRSARHAVRRQRRLRRRAPATRS